MAHVNFSHNNQIPDLASFPYNPESYLTFAVSHNNEYYQNDHSTQGSVNAQINTSELHTRHDVTEEDYSILNREVP